MARSFSRNARNYDPGTYGPFSVDNFTKNDTDRLEWSFSVEAWDPLVDPILSVLVRWSDGTEWRDQYPGAPLNREGLPATVVGGSVQVPRIAGSNGSVTKVDVASGQITITCHATLRTAISFVAVAA